MEPMVNVGHGEGQIPAAEVGQAEHLFLRPPDQGQIPDRLIDGGPGVAGQPAPRRPAALPGLAHQPAVRHAEGELVLLARPAELEAKMRLGVGVDLGHQRRRQLPKGELPGVG